MFHFQVDGIATEYHCKIKIKPDFEAHDQNGLSFCTTFGLKNRYVIPIAEDMKFPFEYVIGN